MKQYHLLLALIVAIAACKGGKDDEAKPQAYQPDIQLSVDKDVCKPGDTVHVTCWAEDTAKHTGMNYKIELFYSLHGNCGEFGKLHKLGKPQSGDDFKTYLFDLPDHSMAFVAGRPQKETDSICETWLYADYDCSLKKILKDSVKVTVRYK